MKLKMNIMLAATLTSLTVGANAAVLFSDNFNTAGNLDGGDTFNTPASLTADQSGTAATKTYTTVHTGWGGAYQRGNGGTWLMHANGSFFDASNTNSRGSLNYDIAAAANGLGSALEVSFNMSVTSGVTAPDWTSFTVGNQNPFVNDGSVGFGSLFRDNGGTQQFSNGTEIGSTITFVDGNLFRFIFSDSTGSGSAFNSDGATDIVKMYIGATLIDTFTGLDLDAADQYISFHANSTVANIDNLSISAIPEPSAALLGGVGLLALLRRRRV